MSTVDPVKERFERDGYMILRQAILPAGVAAIREFVVSYIDRTFADKSALGSEMNLLAQSTEAANIIGPLARGLKSTGLLDALLGPQTFLRLPIGGRCVRPGTTSLAGPHQDSHSHQDEMEDFVVFWVPLVEIDKDCAGVGIYPGLGLSEMPHPVEVGSTPPLVPYFTPGDAIIMHKNLVHCSLPNTSDRTRYSIDMRIFSKARKLRHGGECLDLQTGVSVTL